MRKIKLMKNHEQDGKVYEAGETIEVDVKTYDWLMGVYLADRKALVAKLETTNKIFGDAK